MSSGARGRDRALVRLAGRQHGVVTRTQLRDLGFGERTITRRIERGQLHPRHRGVYAVGRAELSPRGHRMAAVLAGGPSAVLSHRSAAEHWGLLQTAQRQADVTVPGTSRAQRRSLRVHRARTLAPDEVTLLDRIPITSLARTFLDLAAVLSPARLVRAIEQADRLELLDGGAVMAVLARHPHHPGTAKLRRVLVGYAGPPDVRSELERDFVQFVTETGLPQPLLNVKVAGFTVDAYWPDWRLVVELDSRRYHSGHSAFETDRIRDAKLTRARQRVLRVTHRRLHDHAADVLDDIQAVAATA